MSCCNCNCNTPVGQNPPQVKVIRGATPTASGCAIKGWYETLAITSFVPQDFGQTQNITVCDAYQYLPGTCVLLLDTAGNKQVQRVTGRVSATVITLTAYDNADSDESTNLSGTIYAAPLAQCPVASAVAEECQLKNLVTAEAFIIPAADGDVEIVFTESVTLAVGQTVFITGAGYFEVAEPPVGDFEPCSDTFYFTNLGTSGNEDPGDNVASGAVGVLTPPPSTAATNVRGAFFRTMSTGTQSVSEDTAIAFDTATFDDSTDIGTFNAGGSTFTVSVAGWYQFSAGVHFESGSWTGTAIEPHLYIARGSAVVCIGSFINGSGDGIGMVSGTVHCAANDVISIRWQDTGSPGATEVNVEGVTDVEVDFWSGHLVYAD